MRVLIAERDPLLRFALADMVGAWGYEVIAAYNAESALQILQSQESPEIALLDWTMPGLDGRDVRRQLRGSLESRYRYVLMLAARSERLSAVGALESGADDFIAKPVEREELKLRLSVGRRLMTLQNSLRLRASHDALTGVLNRDQIIETLHRECAYAERRGGQLALALIDLDNFKQVNDRHGSGLGDLVLREVAHRMGASLRRYDSIGRYGGDEFLLVLPGCGVKQAMRVAHRIRRKMAEAPVATATAAFVQTVSIGVDARSTRPFRPYEFLQAAGAALYRAKRLGRNWVERGHGDLALAVTLDTGWSDIPSFEIDSVLLPPGDGPGRRNPRSRSPQKEPPPTPLGDTDLSEEE